MLKRTIIFSIFSLTVFAGTLTTQGTGKVTVVPDVAKIHINVTGEHENASEALALADVKAGALISALIGMGVEEGDIATQSLNLHTNHDWQEGRIVRTYFVANHQISVKIFDLDQLGSALNHITSLAGKNSFSLSLDVSNREDAHRLALSRAVADARMKAEIMAGAESLTVADVVSMESHESQPVTYHEERFMDVAAVNVAPGEQTISATVKVTFNLD